VGPDGLVLSGDSVARRAVSSVGAGDSFLAGFLSRFAASEADVTGAFAEALAWGAAAAVLPGSAVPGSADIDRTVVRLDRQPDPGRPLAAG
jgi:1-phosphofructokinase